MQSTSNCERVDKLAQAMNGINRFKCNLWIEVRGGNGLHELEVTFDRDRSPERTEGLNFINVYWRYAPGDGMGQVDLSSGSSHHHEKLLTAGFSKVKELIPQNCKLLLKTLVVHVEGAQSKVTDEIYATTWDALSEVFNSDETERIDKSIYPVKFRRNYLKEKFVSLLVKGAPGLVYWRTHYGNAISLTTIDDADLQNLDLEGTQLERIPFRNSNFSGTKAKSTSFQNSDLSDCKFVESILSDANFYDARLDNADFSRAQLQDCNLSNSACRGTTFSGADLSGADFSHSDLAGADLSNCELTGAKFKMARYNDKTKLPEDFPQWSELKWQGKGADPYIEMKKQTVATMGDLDFPAFIQHLNREFDKARLSKAMSMLKKDRFQLYSDITSDSITGIVKSQTDAELFYACHLNAEGEFACCTQNLNACGGLRGALCKHLLVLVVGLTKTGAVAPTDAARWVLKSTINAKPKLDKDAMAEVFIKFKGVESGEVDWRPTETMPEDYYAF